MAAILAFTVGVLSDSTDPAARDTSTQPIMKERKGKRNSELLHEKVILPAVCLNACRCSLAS
jgi:hypothetical protein